MAVEVMIRKLYDSAVPVDKDNSDAFEKLKPNGIYRAIFTLNRALNSDEITDEQRSVAQNRLYWSWLSDMEKTNVNEYAGNDQDWWHEKMKRKFLMRIYERDCQIYAELLQSVRRVLSAGYKQEADLIYRHVAKETSTTRATVKQFAEYLTNIERTCHGRGIQLRTDARLYELAMNV